MGSEPARVTIKEPAVIGGRHSEKGGTAQWLEIVPSPLWQRNRGDRAEPGISFAPVLELEDTEVIARQLQTLL